MEVPGELDWQNLAIGFLRIAAVTGNHRSHESIMRMLVTRDWEIEQLHTALVNQLKVEDFHRKRIMFFITEDNILVIADVGMTWSHKQWATWMGHNWTYVCNEWIRGFYWPETNSIYFYIGDDCFATNEDRFRTFQCNLITKLGCEDPSIYNGMKPGKPGMLWEPRVVIHKGKHDVEVRDTREDSSDRGSLSG
jgi:hypothetical protein